MDKNQTERLIQAVETIAASLAHINEQGLELFNQSLLTVKAEVSLPDGVNITETPDDLFVKVINPTSYITGEKNPFEIQAVK